MMDSFRKSFVSLVLFGPLAVANGVATFIATHRARIATAQLALAGTGTDTTLATAQAALAAAQAQLAADTAAGAVQATITADNNAVTAAQAAVTAAQAAVTATVARININGVAITGATDLKILAGAASEAVISTITLGSNQFPGGALIQPNDVVTIDITGVPLTTKPTGGVVILDLTQVDV